MEKLRPIHVLSLEGELKCKICNQTSISPIHTCSSGHIVCGTCIDSTKSCRHNCPAPLIPSYFAERLIRKHDVRLPCRNNASWGCKELIKSWEMKDHVESCKRRKGMGVKCFEKKGLRCTEETYMNLDRFAEHLRDYHDCFEATKKAESDEWFTTLMSNRGLKNKNYCVLPSTVFDFDGKYFVLHEVHKDSVVYRWMTIAADHTQDKDNNIYIYCLKISNRQMPLFEWTLPVLLLRKYQNFEKINFKDASKFASLNFGHLKRFCSTASGSKYPYSWKTDVKISKTKGHVKNQEFTNYGLTCLHSYGSSGSPGER